MACSHSATCPLFPLLNASLDGWRRCYCDSRDGWRGCARYQQSLRGQYVPLSLLPNGHDAGHLQQAAVDRAGGPPGAQASGGAPTLVDLLFEHAPAEPDEPARPSAPEPGPTRSWWARIVEWMRTPA